MFHQHVSLKLYIWYIEYKILFTFNTLSCIKKSLIFFYLYIYSNIINVPILINCGKKSVLIEKHVIEFEILFFFQYPLCNKQNVYKLAKH